MYCTQYVAFAGFLRMWIMMYCLSDVQSNVWRYYSGMYAAVVIQLLRNTRKKSFNNRRFAAVFTGVRVRFLDVFVVKRIAILFHNLVTSYFVS